MMKFGGIHYLRLGTLVGKTAHEKARALTAEDLGPELYRIAFRGDGYAGPWYRYQDGDATFLNPGTRVYEVEGYSPEFRLATLERGRVTLYEADTNPHAETGGDLLDIGGKVTAIGIRLADGTSVVRAFWLETGELSRGIMTDPVVTLWVWWRIPHEHLPVGTDGWPGISERLAVRLGLAYLSFNWPGLDAIGKPHSPAARLMRGSEFSAMQGGSAGTTVPDPLVWVVEARGSWRTGGITPEAAR